MHRALMKLTKKWISTSSGTLLIKALCYIEMEEGAEIM